MTKKLFLCIALLASFSFLPAKELKYPVSEIPVGLKENAHTVMRLYKQEIEIKSAKSVLVNVTEVRTILTKNGERNCHFRGSYNPMFKITTDALNC